MSTPSSRLTNIHNVRTKVDTSHMTKEEEVKVKEEALKREQEYYEKVSKGMYNAYKQAGKVSEDFVIKEPPAKTVSDNALESIADMVDKHIDSNLNKDEKKPNLFKRAWNAIKNKFHNNIVKLINRLI